MAYVILARVSTDEQAQSGAGINGQIDACKSFVERNPQPVSQIFIEEDFSGSLPLTKRPVLQEAIASLKRGDTLLVHKRDRLSRGEPFVQGMIEHEIRRRGGTLRSVMGEGTDGDDPTSILIRRITDVFSEHERRMIGQRTSSALQAKKRRNERVGEIPYGYSLGADGVHLEENPAQQAVIRRILSLRASGASIRAICKKLDSEDVPPAKASQWGTATVLRLIRRHSAVCAP